MTAIYRDVMSTLVRVLAADNIDNTTKQNWQKLIDAELSTSGFKSILSGREKFDFDCCLYALLHRELKAEHWDLLVAKYSTHKANKVAAIGRLTTRVQTPAPHLFLYKAVTAWAIPKMKGVQTTAKAGMEVVSRSAKHEEDLKAWGKTVKAKGKKEFTSKREDYVKRSTDMIVLPPEFYDVNTWDLEARPEPTRRRWRNGIYKSLQAIEEAALIHVTEIFDKEEIFGQAA